MRKEIESGGFNAIHEVCGAFVTFEHQAAAQVAAKVLHGGIASQCRQKRYLRYPSFGPPLAAVEAVEAGKEGAELADAMKLGTAVVKRRLVAFPAPHPMDVQHENLPARLGSLPGCRSFNTLGRRIVSRLCAPRDSRLARHAHLHPPHCPHPPRSPSPSTLPSACHTPVLHATLYPATASSRWRSFARAPPSSSSPPTRITSSPPPASSTLHSRALPR